MNRIKPPQLNIPVEDNNDQMNAYSKCQFACGECCGFFRTWLPCLFCFVEYPYQSIDQGKEGLIQRFGRYIKTVKPGLHYINPCTDTLKSVDMRITVIDLDRQSIMTKDNVTIVIDASVYFHIKIARHAIYRIQILELAVKEITYSILKNTVGTFVFQDLLEKRQEIADDIEKQVEKYVEDWQKFVHYNVIRGVQIDHIYIKDVQLTKDIQEALSSAATEQRMAEAKLIQAKADVESAKMMRKASEFLDSKSAMQIRYLETLVTLGTQGITKVCFIPEEKDENRLNHHITQGLIS